MATKSENKKELEAMLGGKIGDEALASVVASVPVAQSTRTGAVTTRRHPFANFPNVCYRSIARDVSGFAITGENGQSSFKLSSFICPVDEVFRLPINIVATPVSTKPFFLTIGQKLATGGADVEITIFAWDHTGAPVPNVFCNWRCRVEQPSS